MVNIRIHNFIFSDKRLYRIQRHLLFWIARFFLFFLWTFSVTLHAILNSGGVDATSEIFLLYEMGLFRLLIDMVYCYAVVYWIFPTYVLKKRYLVSGLLLSAITLISFVFILIEAIYYFDLMNKPRMILYQTIWFQAINFVFSGPLVVCGAFLTIKMMKAWYKKGEEKLAIAKENAEAELQLLTAQIHPHFLFNTLNNIYSFTLAGQQQAAGMVGRLSGMMDYMGIEGEKDWVPVEKEIRLVQDYIDLEKIRYGDRLDIQVVIEGNYKNKMIAPLLMIPFVENCFKHGAGEMRGKQWVKLDLNIMDNMLYFDLSNSKPRIPVIQNGKNGIGLINVQKRLQLIYPGKHVLRIESTDDIYAVHLQVELREQTTPEVNDGLIHQTRTFSYAR